MALKDAPPWMQSWVMFAQAGGLFAQGLDRHLQDALGLSLKEKTLLTTLGLAGGQLRMVDVAQHLLLTRAGATKLVDRLEDQGLVERAPSSTDRRVVNAVLTESGKQRVRDAGPVMRRWVREHYGKVLTERERTELDRLVVKLYEANGWVPGQLSPSP